MNRLFLLCNRMLATRRIPWLMALSAMLLAAWMIHVQAGLINSDGILYVDVARHLLDGNWTEVRRLFPWPFYSALMGAIHLASGLSLQDAAHLITVLSFGASAAGLTLLTRELGGSRAAMLAAALLLLAFPYLARTLLPMIIRDHGFLAAHIWSLLFLQRYARRGLPRDAWLWGGCAALAVMFRIEGITYFTLLPLLLWRQPLPAAKRLARILRAYGVLLCLAVLLGIYLAASHHTLADVGRLSDPWTFARGVLFQVQHGLQQKAAIYGQMVLGKYLQNYALTGLVLTLLFVLVYQAAMAAGFFQFALAAGLGWRCGARNGALPGFLPGLLILGMANAAGVLLSVFVLAGRYLLPVGLIVILYGAFGMEAAWRRYRLGPPLWVKALVIGLMLQIAYIFWPLDAGKFYERDAARWAKQHLPHDSRIYFDHGRTQYYFSGNPCARDQKKNQEVLRELQSAQIRSFDYAMLHAPRNDAQLQHAYQHLLGAPLAQFSHRDQTVAIYRIPDPLPGQPPAFSLCR